jgi:beta-glucosidase
MQLGHSPSHGNFPGENGEVRYGEGLYVGYRGFEHRGIEPRFAFGHGLSYTSFTLGQPDVSSATFRPGEQLSVRIPVTNTGDRAGSEVVQLYVAPRCARLSRPVKELKGFTKVRLASGETTSAQIVLDDRCFSYWDPGHPDYDEMRARVQSHVETPRAAERRNPGWRLDPGDYDLLIGTSAESVHTRVTVTVVTGNSRSDAEDGPTLRT